MVGGTQDALSGKNEDRVSFRRFAGKLNEVVKKGNGSGRASSRCSESHFRQKGPTLTIIRDRTYLERVRGLPHLGQVLETPWKNCSKIPGEVGTMPQFAEIRLFGSRQCQGGKWLR